MFLRCWVRPERNLLAIKPEANQESQRNGLAMGNQMEVLARLQLLLQSDKRYRREA